MRNARWWVTVAVLVALAAFVTGVVRGLTGTSPFEATTDATSLSV